MKYIILISITFFCFTLIMGCSNRLNVTKHIKIQSKGGIAKYSMKLMKGFQEERLEDDFKEWLYIYADSSIMFVTNDVNSGSVTNKYKENKYGRGVFMQILASDTLVLSGKHDEKYWKEIKKNNLVYGYLDVKPERVSEFEDMVESIQICK